MIATALATLAAFGLAFAGLAAGLILGRPAPKGSCGGLGCDACRTCPDRPAKDR